MMSIKELNANVKKMELSSVEPRIIQLAALKFDSGFSRSLYVSNFFLTHVHRGVGKYIYDPAIWFCKEMTSFPYHFSTFSKP